MSRKLFLEKLHNEKGVAAVLVLAVILVLTVLGTIALAAGAVNVSMSGKAKQWSKEYYALDSQAEKYVEMVDSELNSAELKARDYVQKEYCKLPSGSSTFSAISLSEGLDSGFQDIVHKEYQDRWLATPPAIVLKDVEYYIASSSYPTEDAARDAYKDDVKTFESELFDRAYFYYASKKLNALEASIAAVTSGTAIAIVLDDSNSTVDNPGVIPGNPCTSKFTTNYTLKDWLSYKPQNGDLILYIYVDNSDMTSTDAKKVIVKMDVTLPKYETVLQYIDVPFKGNPIWANAITAKGGIEVSPGSKVSIEGDVFASDGGLQCDTDAEINITGNLYTAGVVHVTGNNGKINVVRGGSAIGYTAKKGIYDNFSGDNYLSFSPNIAQAALIAQYTEGTATPGTMPFIFDEYSNWGNVFCSKLSVDDSVTSGASINIGGNLMVESDIQMDGQHSNISIGTVSGGAIVTNCIGLNSESASFDPNLSSSIANNYPFEADGVSSNSSITINSALFVPGVAFYEFDEGGPDDSKVGDTNPKYYYKSAESVSSRVTSPTAIFDAYYATEGSGYISTAYRSNGNKYYLTSPSGIEMLTGLGDFITSAGGIKTNIIGTPPPQSYVLGAALMQGSDSVNATVNLGIGIFTGPTYTAYDNLKITDTLLDIYYAKTKGLGVTSGTAIFADFVNKPYSASSNGLLYLPGGASMNISSTINGIIYCTGDLTLTGNGEFNGTIICEGKLSINSSNLSIKYNEDVIITKLRNNAGVRKFFDTPAGSMGTVIGHATDYSTTSGTKTQVKRYKVLSWIESQK